ncbi:MAG: alpha/beta hydrolase [Bacteroidota bacterium]|nr:alpha/beta hydrolase [Bacteroidota bacterium]
MSTKTLIIHGWSDNSKSFNPVKTFLLQNGMEATSIYFADYQSREDNLTFNDIADGLNDQMIENGLISPEGNSEFELNVIVHSTGGLVIRYWIWKYYFSKGNNLLICPIKKLIMLAPANFGSPLAAGGKSLLGQLFKGQKDIQNPFEVGKKILDGLELASPFQWDLAHKDLLIDEPYYNANQIQLTVLVGDSGYTGLKKIFSKPGTDGTVVVAGTNLNTAKITIDSNNKTEPLKWAKNNTISQMAFGIIKGINHGTIVELFDTESTINQLVLKALNTKNKEAFISFIAEVNNNNSYENQNFQQFIFRAIDDFGEPIRDYNIEFFVRKAGGETRYGLFQSGYQVTTEELECSNEIDELITEQFHRHSIDASLRSILIPLEEVNIKIEKFKAQLNSDLILCMKIFVPSVDNNISYDIENLDDIVLVDTRNPNYLGKSFFFANTTTLVEMVINRRNTYVKISQ